MTIYALILGLLLAVYIAGSLVAWHYRRAFSVDRAVVLSVVITLGWIVIILATTDLLRHS